MRAASEIRWTVSALVIVQLLLTFGVIALIVRMTPGVDEVLAEDVSSLTAIDQMYSLLAGGECGTDATALAAPFDQAYRLAQGSAHDAGEQELIEKIGKTWNLALACDREARAATIENLRALANLNRASIENAHRQGHELGVSGAWATAFLGVAAFGIGTFLMFRFVRRMATPLEEVEAVLSAVVRGDPYRRCRRIEAPAEYTQIAARLNQFLDRRLAREEEEDPQLANLDRALLHHLLDTLPDPVVAVDTSGAIIAASDGAMDLLAGTDLSSISDALASGGEDDDAISLIQRVEPFGRSDGFILSLVRRGADDAGDETADVPFPPGSPRFRGNPLADSGAADAKRVEKAEPSNKKDGREDWQRD
jgi:hypothetical protein